MESTKDVTLPVKAAAGLLASWKIFIEDTTLATTVTLREKFLEQVRAPQALVPRQEKSLHQEEQRPLKKASLERKVADRGESGTTARSDDLLIASNVGLVEALARKRAR